MAETPEQKEEPIEMYRTLTVTIDEGGGKIRNVDIPFDLLLIQRFEETLHKCGDIRFAWLRYKKSDETIIRHCKDFAEKYLPKDLVNERTAPTFYTLFFSSVKAALISTMSGSVASMISTPRP